MKPVNMAPRDRRRLAENGAAAKHQTQLVEAERGVLFLREVDENGAVVSESGPLFSDPVALARARELFPEHLPWAGMPVDGG